MTTRQACSLAARVLPSKPEPTRAHRSRLSLQPGATVLYVVYQPLQNFTAAANLAPRRDGAMALFSPYGIPVKL